MEGECIDDQDIEINSYDFDADLLAGAAGEDQVEEVLHSHLLKSNCLITNQPDWGSVEIRYQGAKIDREKLLRYLVSFREHNEFHEQCVERIFTDLMKYCQPNKLTVFARYTRRGGLDINLTVRQNKISQLIIIAWLVNNSVIGRNKFGNQEDCRAFIAKHVTIPNDFNWL